MNWIPFTSDIVMLKLKGLVCLFLGDQTTMQEEYMAGLRLIVAVCVAKG